MSLSFGVREAAKRWSGLCAALVLVACGAKRVEAQPQFPRELTEQMEAMFDRFLGDSAAEQRRLAAVDISPEEEQRVGQARMEQFRASLKQQDTQVIDRGPDVEYLRALVDVLRPHLRNAQRYDHFRISLIDLDETEAGSLPGGIVVATRGLLEFAPSEAALVGILAHELAHIDRGHQLDGLRRIKLFEQALSQQNRSPDALFADGMLFAKQFARPFRPDQETEADADATDWMFAAGYDPRQMAEMFDRLHRRDAGRQLLNLPNFLRSHPYHRDRSRAIRQRFAELRRANPRVDLYVGRQNLRTRTPRDQRRFPE